MTMVQTGRLNLLSKQVKNDDRQTATASKQVVNSILYVILMVNILTWTEQFPI